MPVINKIDLPSAEPERVKEEIEDVIGIDAENAPLISAKTGLNVHEVLEQIVQQIPSPVGDPDAPLQALIFDSKYDSYKGVIVFCRIKEGTVKKGTPMLMMATGAKAEVVEVGTFGAGQFIPCDALEAGMVGYITASLKNVKDTRVGDTITNAENPCAEPLPGYKEVNPMVYCGLYPADGAKYPDLRDALEKEQPDLRMLVNSAGFGKSGSVEEISSEKFRIQTDMVDVNCRSLTRMTLLCLPFLRAGSRSVNLASAAAFCPQPYFSVYAAS